MLRTLDYVDIGSTTMNKRYTPHTSAGTEIIFVDNEAITINSSQRWFWTDRWQTGEKKADDDIKNDNIHRFNNNEEALDFLK